MRQSNHLLKKDKGLFMTNQYDYIIIGADQSDLTPNPSPKGEGNRCSKNKAPVLYRGLTMQQLLIYRFH
jgi:hypothetical protein